MASGQGDAARKRPGLPVLEPGHTYATVTDQISTIVLSKPTPRRMLVGFAIAFTLLVLLLCSIVYLLAVGVGISAAR